MLINFCDGCDTAKHCGNTPEHKRPCQNMERQEEQPKARYLLSNITLRRRDLAALGLNSQGHYL